VPEKCGHQLSHKSCHAKFAQLQELSDGRVVSPENAAFTHGACAHPTPMAFSGFIIEGYCEVEIADGR
jgi:hypothetical protein